MKHPTSEQLQTCEPTTRFHTSGIPHIKMPMSSRTKRLARTSAAGVHCTASIFCIAVSFVM